LAAAAAAGPPSRLQNTETNLIKYFTVQTSLDLLFFNIAVSMNNDTI